MKYDLVIFDLDGTMLNTLEDLASACNAALSSNGFPTHDLEKIRLSVGSGVSRLIRLTLPESAILSEGRESFVLRVTDKAEDGSFMLERVPVTVGVSDGVNVAVDGIAEGDEIVDNADSYRMLVGRPLTLSDNSMLAASGSNMFMMGGMGGMSGGGRSGNR